MTAGALGFDRLRNSGDGGRAWEPVLSLKAALCWLRAGDREQSRKVLRAARQLSPGPRVALGARQVAWFGDNDDPAAWLESALRTE